ncbi:DEAD/DEAH box helicase [Pseudomonas sp. GL-B-26]|uniref:DEAD/DEAH box helicase n=1 Tax=Pseudomonas sp. GL-B-26 TaxID=2832394 RepID=UPI001CBD0CEB|nr:helicase-related protein [Pseudomonas sp. GL-B-26]
MAPVPEIPMEEKSMTRCISERDQASLELKTTLDGLKDFQRATVTRIAALFKDPQHSRRVLVADEVGLGKTIVAKGLIATMLLEWREPRPFRVTYICSNLALATENRSKLAVFSDPHQHTWVREPSFSRLAEVALLPDEKEQVNALLEVCTLTPGTSFSLTRGSGNRRERSIIFSALLQHPEIKPLRRKLTDLFREHVQDAEGWESDLDEIEARGLDPTIVGSFHQALLASVSDGGSSILEQVRKAAGQRSDKHNDDKRNLLRHLRVLFARSCAGHLQANLFILDEFQRFDSLLDQNEENEHSLIARKIFSKNRGCNILLLSATPFKAMSTIADDENDDGHLVKLKQILEFLNLSPLDAYEPARKSLQSELLRLRQDNVKVTDLCDSPRHEVERLLRPLISRTERSQIAVDVDSLVNDKPLESGPELQIGDIKAYVELDQLASMLESNSRLRLSRQMMDFFKSAAWPLSFSTGYKLQEVLKRQYDLSAEVYKRVNGSKSLWLPRERVRKYRLNVAQEAPNPQVRWLTSYLFGDEKKHGPEMMLWIPPSRPHYPLSGFFAGREGFSKTLLFSAWAMVPRMISGLLSYESERRVQQHSTAKAEYFSKRRGGQSQDELDKQHEQRRAVVKLDSGDLANWSLIYPGRTFIEMPIERTQGSLEQRIRELTVRMKLLLKPLRSRYRGSRNQNHWYLFAPMLLDEEYHPGWSQDWFARMRRVSGLSGGVRHRIEEVAQRFGQLDELGAMPDDLAEYLAWLAVGSPAICAYRAMQQNYPGDVQPDHASRVAMAFVSLFNGVAGSAVIKRINNPQHWRSIVEYCARGGVQAMLEEYVYMLSAAKGVEMAVGAIDSVLRTTPSNVKVWKAEDAEDTTHLRCHYAVQLGTQKTTDEAGQERVVSIRESFNSPFRPFVLASTSIGQEGLDFHWYCSEVVHWNLPNNPIDLEQREGRVNRFQSLVVRRRVVQALSGEPNAPATWTELFQAASERPKQTDLVPYWHFPEGDAQIRRLIPTLAMSQESQRYPHMQKILSLYRLAFGQPGQSELLEHLKNLNLGSDELAHLKKRLMIQLAPVLYLSSN